MSFAFQDLIKAVQETEETAQQSLSGFISFVNPRDDSAQLSNITDDSREAGPSVFFLAGPENGRFLEDAIQKGVTVFLAAESSFKYILESGLKNHLSSLKFISVKDTYFSLVAGYVASAFYGHPSRSLYVAGITGTNGKTTTASMVRHIWEKTGIRSGIIGTLGVEYINYKTGKEVRYKTGYTTPRAHQLQRILREMLDSGVTHVIMEVSSEAVSLGRIEGCVFRAAGFTNLTLDHLDYHKSMENYFQAKYQFLKQADAQGAEITVWTGDEFGKRLETENSQKKNWTFFKDPPADLHLPVPVGFNLINASLALQLSGTASVNSSGIFQDYISAEGRFQVIPVSEGRFAVVDYAHTPDGLEKLLSEVRRLGVKSSIAVFGCGGDRDRKKRPLMGGIAETHADTVILTNDNPRTEDPESILNEIESGITSGVNKTILRIPDRRSAIHTGYRILLESEPPAALVIAGKGHETVQIFKDHTEKFSDSEELLAVLGK